MPDSLLVRLLLVAASLLPALGCTVPALRPARLVIDDAPYVFDTVYGPPVMHHFVVRNDGDEPTGTLAVELHGDTHSFTVANNRCGGLIGHGECFVDVAFADEEAGEYRAQLTVHAPLPGVLANAEMSGRVSPASFSIMAASTPVIRGSATPLAATIHNDGGARSGAMKVIVDGATLSTDPCSGTALTGGDTCVVNMVVTAPLHGAFATPPTVTVTDGNGAATTTTLDVLLADPGALRFAGYDSGPVDPAVQGDIVTVANPGPETTGALRISVSDITGDPSLGGRPVFAIASVRDGDCSGARLAPGTSCSVAVVFDSATTLGPTYSARLTVSADNIDDASATVTMTAVRNSALVTLGSAGGGSGRILDGGRSLCSGGAQPACLQFRLRNGATSSFTAAANAGSTFAGWTGGGCGASPTCTITAHDNQDITVIATFN